MKRIKPNFKNIVLTVSYGNYACGKGGTDKVIKAHQEMLNKKDTSVLHLFRAYTIGEKIKIRRNDVWNVLVDGKQCGLYSTKELLQELYILNNKGFCIRDIFIHHLNNIVIKELGYILQSLSTHIYFYLHDYYTICCSSGLIDAQGVFCGVEGPDKYKCEYCESFNPSMMVRLGEIRSLFDTIKDRVTFVAPSDIAKNIWLKTYPQYTENIIVIYHQKFSGNYKDNKELKEKEQPLNIAFVGYQRPLKGWNIWHDAVKEIYNDVNYKFFQMGTTNVHEKYIKEIEVDFKKNLNSMVMQLRNNHIDVAVLWSLWPETYSYTLYEAMASNAFILTNYKSGNIAYQVKIRENGIVAADINGLKDILLDENRLREKVNQFKLKEAYGPLQLEENDMLLSLVNYECRSNCKNISCGMVEHICVGIYNLVFNIYKSIKRKKNICI